MPTSVRPPSPSDILSVHTDCLGPTWVATSFALPEDDGGSPPGRPGAAVPIHEADASDLVQKSGAATPYLLGFPDSFFHVEQVATSHEAGVPPAGLDICRCGRSVRSNTPRDDLRDIYVREEEIGLAIRRLRSLGAGWIALIGHPTGDLQATLWIADNPGMIDAVVLNSPWLDHNGGAFEHGPLTRPIDRVEVHRPRLVSSPLFLRYARALRTDFDDEFSFDPHHKSLRRAVIRMGFIRTIRRAQTRIAAGDAKIDAPPLVAHSDTSSHRPRFPSQGGVAACDAALRVEDMKRLAPLLSERIDMLKTPGGRHDLVPSAKLVQEAYICGAIDWVRKMLGL